MLLVRPISLGTLKVEQFKNGNFAVTNNEKPPHRITLSCRSLFHGERMIEKIEMSLPGELIEL